MEIEILELIDGAKRARGTAVIIDVFRAFTLESSLFARGASAIWPAGSVEEARALKAAHPAWPSFGERGGAKIEGFDCGNSPSEAMALEVAGRQCIHTTSAGTQGIVNATGADCILGACLANARATAAWISRSGADTVSLVAMGNAGTARADEDVLCARYIRALLEGADPIQAHARFQMAAYGMAEGCGAKFFDPERPEFPEDDFVACTTLDRYPFAILCGRDAAGCLVHHAAAVEGLA